MDSATIKQIREYRDQLKKSIKLIKSSKYPDNKFGSEIHNDPLRKHDGKSSHDGSITDDMKNAIKDIKGIKKLIETIETHLSK